MHERVSDGRSVPPSGPPVGAGGQGEATPKDHFLQLMLFQASRRAGESHEPQKLEPTAGSYAPLPHSVARPGDRYGLPRPSAAAPIRLDSSAIEVMTDLRRVSAVTVDRDVSIDVANRTMIVRGVRALFVVDDARQLFGIITSTDILGERPIQFAQERGIRHRDVLVRDIMTPAERLEILDFRDVERSRVGDIVATLKLASRQHALVVEMLEATPGQPLTVRGIFSLTQIARRLGIAPQQVHDIARTFAEIEAAIVS